VEDINWRASRSLDRSLVATLTGGDWLRNAQNLLITAMTGCGKNWLACALAHQAARSGFSVLYTRAARLFDELQVAHGGRRQLSCPPGDNYPGRWEARDLLMVRVVGLSLL
jgi:DNA replication protein DnaC